MPRHIHGVFEDSLDKTCYNVLLLKSPVVKSAGDRPENMQKTSVSGHMYQIGTEQKEPVDL